MRKLFSPNPKEQKEQEKAGLRILAALGFLVILPVLIINFIKSGFLVVYAGTLVMTSEKLGIRNEKIQGMFNWVMTVILIIGCLCLLGLAGRLYRGL